MKTCTKCKIEKELDEFCKNKNNKDGLNVWCRECAGKNEKKWIKRDLKVRPWINSYNNAKQRCENPNNPNYPWWGAKDIKFLLSQEEMNLIWYRDGADYMKFPTIDRINKHGNYELDNCQFLENIDNLKKDNIGHWYKGKYIKYCKIGQYTKEGTLIKIWDSQGIASLELGIDQGTISKAIKNGYSRYGFYWKNIKE